MGTERHTEPASALDVPKLALTRTECARAMSVGIRTVDQLIAGRRGNGFPVAYIGSKPLMPLGPLQDWLARQAKGAKA